MIRVFHSSVIPASVDRVWSIVRDFNALPRWLPAAVTSAIEDDRDPATVGCIRHVVASDGSIVRERLVELSDTDHRCSYALLSSPYPMRDYVATFQLYPVEDERHCYMAWSSTFAVDGDKQEDTVRFVREMIYARGFARLKQLVAAPAE